MKSTIEQNIFREFIDKDPDTGIKFDNGQYIIGKKHVTLDYTKVNAINDYVTIKIFGTHDEFNFTVDGLIELFGTYLPPNFTIVTPEDFVHYGNLLRVTGFDKNSHLDNTRKNVKLISRMIPIISHKIAKNYTQNTLNKKLQEIYNESKNMVLESRTESCKQL